MKLNLKRPIVFFDLETTGVDTAKDRIVEISMVKVMPDGEEIVKTRKINPGIHIPEEATAIHGITDEDVKDCPTFAQIARSLEQFIAGCDFGGFNSNRFDLPMLVEEFMRGAAERGELTVTDPADAYRELWGLAVRDTQIRVLLGEPSPTPEEIDEAATVAMEQFMAAHQPSA